MDVDEYMAIHTYIPFVFHMQLFARRSQYVRPAEMQWWQELSFQFMTEESGGESTEEITCRPLPWRSESKFKLMHICKHVNCTTALLFGLFAGATKFIHKLDGRYKKDCLKRGSSNFQVKTRTPGSPSTLPRLSGPEWTLKPAPDSTAPNSQIVREPTSDELVPTSRNVTEEESVTSQADSGSEELLKQL